MNPCRKDGKGHSLGELLRRPFTDSKFVNEHGELKAGLKAYQTLENFLVNAEFKQDGAFSWANPILKKGRAGLVDRYGLSDSYIDLDRKRESDVRRILRQGEGILEGLAEHGVESMAEAKVLQAILTGEQIADSEWQKVAEPIRKAIDDMGYEAMQLGLLSRESYERNRGAYLHRVYKKHEDSGLGKWLSSKRKNIKGNQLKGRGMHMTPTMQQLLKTAPKDWWGKKLNRLKADPSLVGKEFVVFDRLAPSGQGTDEMFEGEKRKGKVIERVFWPADREIPNKYKAWEDRGRFEVRDVKGPKVVLWRDFTKAERTNMGEILDARYTIAKTYHQMAHDLSTGRFLKDIASNEMWARSDEPENWDNPRQGMMNTHADVEWIKVPGISIPGTGGKKRWGALAGMYVRSEIWRDLNELDKMQTPGFWQKILTQWKLNKTARSPVVHMNNVMSNLVFMDMADVRFRDLYDGIQSYRDKDDYYKEAEEYGAFGGGFADQEIRKVMEPLLDEILQKGLSNKGMFEAAMNGNDVSARFSAIGKMMDVSVKHLKALDEKALAWYQVEDELFRMATFIRRRSLGDDAQTAAKIARDQFLNYDIRAPWVNAARATILPFIAYTYRAVPVISKSMATRPWKLAKYYLIANAVIALSYSLDEEGDEEEEYKTLREEQKGQTWIGTPRMIRTPWRDDNDNPVFLDVRRWIPAGDVFDVNQGSSAFPIPAWLQFGGPVMLAAEFSLNKSAFTGDEISNDLIDTPAERGGKVFNHLWKSWMPSAPWVPGSWYWDKIGNALNGSRDSLMREYSLPLATLSSIGIKATPHDPKLGRSQHGNQFDSVQRELSFVRSQLEKDRRRGLIDSEEYQSQKGLIEQKFKRLQEKAREVLQ